MITMGKTLRPTSTMLKPPPVMVRPQHPGRDRDDAGEPPREGEGGPHVDAHGQRGLVVVGHAAKRNPESRPGEEPAHRPDEQKRDRGRRELGR